MIQKFALHQWGPEFASRSLPLYIRGGRVGVGGRFLSGSSRFPLPQISFHHFLHCRSLSPVGTDKEEEKILAGPQDTKELSSKGGFRRNGKWEEDSWQKKISDDRQHHDKWTVCRYEKEGREVGRVEDAEFAVKDLPLGRTL